MAYSITMDLGTGLTRHSTTGNYTYDLDGHSFNPPLPSGWSDGTENAVPTTEGSGRTTPDLTGYYPGHEAILGSVLINGPYNGTVEMRWKDPAGTTFFTFSFSMNIADGSYGWAFSYVGVKSDQFGSKEIYSNGQYNFEVYVPGDTTYNNYFTTSNLNTALLTTHSGKQGYIWVDGENICFIGYDGNKHIIKHDGSTYGNHGGPGTIWLPDAATAKHIKYIDESGDERSTHLSDEVGWGEPVDGVGSTGHTPGYMWCENGFNQAALMFINCDGVQHRISNGWLYGNGY